MTRLAFLLALVPLASALAADPPAALPPDPELRTFCAGDPAFRPDAVRAVIGQELAREHDPALDDQTPEQILEGTISTGITECVRTLHRDPSIYAAIDLPDPIDRSIAWDAYNSACGDRVAARGACIVAEVAAQHALKRMSTRNVPPGARALVQACELVLVPQPPLAEWRECVDMGLANRAPPARAEACKLKLPWHTAHSGKEAGQLVQACIGKGEPPAR
jgi:hypothetical protein